MPINKCILNEIIISLEINSKGIISHSKLIKAPKNQELQNKIIHIVENHPGNWKPAITNNHKKDIQVLTVFELHNIAKKTVSHRSGFSVGNYSYTTHTIGVSQNKHKNCIDNEYYYDLAIDEFRKEKYKRASNYFKLAIKSNRYDVDSHYNLGITYIKLEKIEEACESFVLAAKYGDEESKKMLVKHCQKSD